MQFDVKIKLEEPSIIQKFTNRKLGNYMATEWSRLIDPYVPYWTGNLSKTIDINPFTITYYAQGEDGQGYARDVYEGFRFGQYVGTGFKKTYHPFATMEWDKAAQRSGQLDKLCQRVSDYLSKQKE